VAHTCNPAYSGDRDQEDHSSKPAQVNSSGDPISKIPTQNSTSGMAQVVEHLQTKCEALSSNPSATKKKKKKKKRN
jgi:hypothetical protein